MYPVKPIVLLKINAEKFCNKESRLLQIERGECTYSLQLGSYIPLHWLVSSCSSTAQLLVKVTVY